MIRSRDLDFLLHSLPQFPILAVSCPDPSTGISKSWKIFDLASVTFSWFCCSVIVFPFLYWINHMHNNVVVPFSFSCSAGSFDGCYCDLRFWICVLVFWSSLDFIFRSKVGIFHVVSVISRLCNCITAILDVVFQVWNSFYLLNLKVVSGFV